MLRCATFRLHSLISPGKVSMAILLVETALLHSVGRLPAGSRMMTPFRISSFRMQRRFVQPATTTPQKGANIVKARPTGPLPIRLPVAQQRCDGYRAPVVDQTQRRMTTSTTSTRRPNVWISKSNQHYFTNFQIKFSTTALPT